MAHDREGFKAFAVERLPALHRSALFLVRDPFLAEDLVQETLERLYLAWGTREIEHPAAYAHTTLTRVFLSSKRRRSSTERPLATMPEGAYDDAGLSDLAARLDLDQALSELSDLDRAIVVMRYLEDRSVNDVAAALEKSPGNIRIRASRALGRLRGVVERHPAAEPTSAKGHHHD